MEESSHSRYHGGVHASEFLNPARVPSVYVAPAFLGFFSILPFREMNNLRRINPPALE